jgi:methyl-accepting chemotaxis protein
MKDRRKKINFSVKREMQLRLLLKILSIVTIGIGIMGLIFYFYSNREIGNTYRQFHVTAKNFLDYLLPVVIISLVVGFLASIVITIFFPHKIVGPLYRIERDLKKKVGDGDLSVKFILRKGDEVQELADAVNITIDKLKEKIECVNHAVDRIDGAIKNKVDDEELERLVKELKETVNVFKL